MTAPLSLISPDGSFSVRFKWNGDRYAHWLIGEDGNGNEICSMNSIEGRGETDWPSSPPIQQLSLEKMQMADVLLGLGGAGLSHWSISVHWVSLAEAPAVKFELACRYKTKPIFLGSQYESNDGFTITPGEDSELVRSGDSILVQPHRLMSDRGTICWSYSIKPVG
ncbi:hypothetical protein CA13_37040 [Planctomycetes bacterium CA13]|uniref:Uncharacterized protein n=1 Tax=Novipirellula herctigrandis TaxID=2527986 RepID=A0A5C5Z4G6_9BACT|nr:hypothetical protein CA13_37040 [Planctomycetes bacterium CA13]